MNTTKNCESCHGTGIRVHEAFSYGDHHYPRREERCISCSGRGVFEPPDAAAIEAELRSPRGGMRSKAPSGYTRAYYVWRMVRFHAGKDMTMPVNASLAVHGDPFRAELDEIVDTLATKFYGTNLAAAVRWGRALGVL